MGDYWQSTLTTFLSSDFKLCFFVSLELVLFLCSSISDYVCKGNVCNFPQLMRINKVYIIIRNTLIIIIIKQIGDGSPVSNR